MPYISQGARDRLRINRDSRPENKGELTYLLTLQVLAYLRAHGKRFDTLGDILAALDATSKEFYRRVVAGYEQEKIQENGDVYPT